MVILSRNTILSRAVSYEDFFKSSRYFPSAVSTSNEIYEYSEIKSVLCCKKSQLVASVWMAGVSWTLPGTVCFRSKLFNLLFLCSFTGAYLTVEIILLRFRQVNENVFEVSDQQIVDIAKPACSLIPIINSFERIAWERSGWDILTGACGNLHQSNKTLQNLKKNTAVWRSLVFH